MPITGLHILLLLMQSIHIKSKDPNSNREYIIEPLNLIHYIGKGAFGHVVKCKCLTYQMEYAAKIIDYKMTGFPKEIYEYECLNASKIRAYSKTVSKSTNLVVAEDECETKEQYYIIYPLYKKKDLRFILSEMDQRLPESEVWELIRHIANGLYHLHSKLNLIHRDLKIENIFVSDNEDEKGEYYSKNIYYIGDFGLTRDRDDATTNCGSVETKAPEIQSGKYDTRSDIWSLGIIMYYVLYGIYPFHSFNFNALTVQLQSGTYRVYTQQKVSELAICFLESCLQRDPSERILIGDIYKFLKLDELNKPFKVPYNLQHTFSCVNSEVLELSIDKGKRKYHMGPIKLLETSIYKAKQVQYSMIPMYLSVFSNDDEKEDWINAE